MHPNTQNTCHLRVYLEAIPPFSDILHSSEDTSGAGRVIIGACDSHDRSVIPTSIKLVMLQWINPVSGYPFLGYIIIYKVHKNLPQTHVQ